MAAEKLTLKEFRSLRDRMSGDEEIQQRFFAEGAVFPSSSGNHEFILQTIKGLLEAGVGFSVLQQGGQIGISGGEDIWGTDLLPQLWADGRWHIGHEPYDGSEDEEDGDDGP